MDPQRTYTLTERDHYGQPVNTITGLTEQRAEIVALALRTGDAYTNKQRPWTCEITREPNREEQMAATVSRWIDKQTNVTSAAEAVACLRHVADRLETLGDMPLAAGAILDVSLHITGRQVEPFERMTLVDQLAAAVGIEAELPESGHYTAGHLNGLRFLTIVDPPALKPLVSDETIRQAEDISRMVAPMDLALPKADCGCPIKSFGVDHCEACEACEAGQPVAPQRVEEILAELNALTQRPDEAAVDWWDWISDQPEFDREATAAAPTGELHLVDGTVLVWQATPAAWERVKA